MSSLLRVLMTNKRMHRKDEKWQVNESLQVKAAISYSRNSGVNSYIVSIPFATSYKTAGLGSTEKRQQVLHWG